MEPQIIVPDYRGLHNVDPRAVARLQRQKLYQDCSTIIVSPVTGPLEPKIVQSWMGLIRPMNQKVIGPVFVTKMEVGHAYTEAAKWIINDPELRSWKYMLTLERDNMPPPDGLIKLIESMENGKYDAVGGLYWTKGEGGQPMIYGDPQTLPRNYLPQVPVPDMVQPCNGLGMGFTLFRIKMLQDPQLEWPLFKTVQEYTPGRGTNLGTQDLFFFEQASRLGYKFASDNRVLVGHYDEKEDRIW